MSDYLYFYDWNMDVGTSSTTMTGIERTAYTSMAGRVLGE